jgi:hypothetical protein
MEPVRFYYSTNGTDVQGPVTEDGLRQLFQDEAIGPSSYICREGENEWQPFNPDSFLPSVESPPGPPPFEPPPFVPTPEALAPTLAAPRKKSWLELGYVQVILNTIAGVVAVGAAAIMAGLSDYGAHGDDALSYKMGAVTGVLFVTVLIPILISRWIKGPGRIVVRTILIIGLSLVTLIGKVGESYSQLKLKETADAMSEKIKADAQKQIAQKGYYDGNGQEVEQDLQTLKNQATDDSLTSRVARDLFALTDELLAKVKVSTTAENACDFEVGNIASLDDIARRRALIVKLHDTQADVITFLQNFDAHAREAMAHDNFSPDVVAGAIAGTRKSGHIDLLIALWQLKMKLSDDYVARLDFLKNSYGTWKAEGGKLLFPDDASLAAFNGFGATLQNDAKQLGDLQKQIYQ